MEKVKLLLLALVVSSSLSAYEYSMELFGGVIYNMNSDLTYKVSGQNDIVLKDVALSTKPFTVPPYYGFRVSVWDPSDDTAWELEHIHQKLYISDSDLDGTLLDHWEMTDGFNFFFLNKAWKLDNYWEGLILRAGSGLVITHPDVTYDGERLNGDGHGALVYGGGYDYSGYAWQVSSQKTFYLTQNWFLSLETRLTMSYAWAKDEGSNISEINNTAFHLNYGVGYKW